MIEKCVSFLWTPLGPREGQNFGPRGRSPRACGKDVTVADRSHLGREQGAVRVEEGGDVFR